VKNSLFSANKKNTVEESALKKPKRVPFRKNVMMTAVGMTVDSASFAVSTFFKLLTTLLLIFVFAGLLFAVIFAYYVKTSLTPSVDISLEDYRLSESSSIYYQNTAGEWEELTALSGSQNRVWVDYRDIPEDMIHALIAIEDKRFYDHKGVDWYRTSGAFVKMFATMQTNFGGSTITQQLIKNLTGQDDVTITRKLKEIFSALELEKKYDKEEILEWYLNAVYFGEGAWGVQTAAQTYFGKDVSELTAAQCACIVGITNQPTNYDPFYNEEANKARQETILREMYEQGYLTYDEYKEAVNEDISSEFVHSVNTETSQSIYTYYEEVVIADVLADLMEEKGVSYDTAVHLLYNSGYKIYCCLDSSIQSVVDTIYKDRENMPRATSSSTSQSLQSAICVMDPYTGKLVALYGGIGEKTINFGLNRATQTKRSPGSTIKPLASYGPAVDLGLITPDTKVMDNGYISLNGTSWFPENDGGYHLGEVTILRALTLSINTVAAQIIDKLPDGPVTAYNYLTQRLGFTSLVPDDASYAPMALGQMTYGVTVREMCAAYCSFVNDGVYTAPRTYTLVTDSKGATVLDNVPEMTVAFSPDTAHIMTYMMRNVVKSGTGTEAAISNMPIAGKTGTSGEYQDRWFVGCSPYYVAAVWTGYDTPDRVRVNGNPAARIFRRVMTPIHQGLTYKEFPDPVLNPDTHLFITPTFDEYYYEDYYTDESGEVIIYSGDGNSPFNQEAVVDNSTVVIR